MQNFINYTNNALITTSTTLGYLPGMTLPAQLLVCNATGNITVTLPPTSSILPVLPPAAPGYGQTIDGIGGGIEITVFNQAGTGAVTISPASAADTIIGSPNLAASASVKVKLTPYPAQTAWYVTG